MKSKSKTKIARSDKFSKKDTDKLFAGLGSYGDGMKKKK